MCGIKENVIHVNQKREREGSEKEGEKITIVRGRLYIFFHRDQTLLLF